MIRKAAQMLALTLSMVVFATAGLDYATFVYRQRHGTALDSVTVRQFLATPLKNGRSELDFLGEIDQPCVRALLPHQQMAPCWWVRQHKDRWTRS